MERESPFPDEQQGQERASCKEGCSDVRGGSALGCRSSAGAGAADGPGSSWGEGKKGSTQVWVANASDLGRHLQKVFSPLRYHRSFRREAAKRAHSATQSSREDERLVGHRAERWLCPIGKGIWTIHPE